MWKSSKIDKVCKTCEHMKQGIFIGRYCAMSLKETLKDDTVIPESCNRKMEHLILKQKGMKNASHKR